MKTRKAFRGVYFFNYKGVDIAITEESDGGFPGKWGIRKADVEDGKLIGWNPTDVLMPSKKEAVAEAIRAIDSGFFIKQ